MMSYLTQYSPLFLRDLERIWAEIFSVSQNLITSNQYINDLMDKIEKDDKKAILSNDLSKLRKLFPEIDFNFDYAVKTINEDTPLFKKKNTAFYYPKLETLLVDLISDKTLCDLYSSEIENIYKNAFREYAIKINRLFRYADKKGSKERIKSLLKYIDFDIERGEFNYD